MAVWHWRGFYEWAVAGSVYTESIYQAKAVIMPETDMNSEMEEAKLFWNGRSQAVRLPKEFRFEGDRVRVSRMGAGVLLEPLPEKREESIEEWFARIDAMRGDPIFPKGRRQKLAPVREYFK